LDVQPDDDQRRWRRPVRRQPGERRVALVPGERIREVLRQGRRHRPRAPRLRLPDRPTGGESQMSTTQNGARSAPPAPPPVTSAAEAEKLVRHLIAATEALVSTVEQETALVRAGHVAQAAPLNKNKSELATA